MKNLLIEANELKEILATGADILVFDVRHDLVDHALGARAYAQGHIPGAIFLDHETDLSGKHTGKNGRHPLPDRGDFAVMMRLHGLSPEKQVVVYDANGTAFSTHLWWLLRWLGHTNVRVLNGGWAAWVAAGGKVENTAPASRVTEAQAIQSTGWSSKSGAQVITAEQVLENLKAEKPAFVILDSRTPERYRGETEPMDPVAGRIPGALNRPNTENMASDGRFKSPEVLRNEFERVLGALPSEQVVHQCGSGISASHNLFSMELAGLPGSRLYHGSWSEWCSDPERPVARG